MSEREDIAAYIRDWSGKLLGVAVSSYPFDEWFKMNVACGVLLGVATHIENGDYLEDDDAE